MQHPTTITENGAPSFSTTNDARLDLFSKVCRDTETDRLAGLLERSWAVSPLDTLKIVFHLRDCRGGKGERQQFTNAMKWVLDNHRQEFVVNFPHIPFYGRWKDLLGFFGTAYEAEMVKYYASQLQSDLGCLLMAGGMEKKVSLAAKYAPSEGQAFDTKYQAAAKFAKSLGMNKRGYRVNVLRPLRTQIDSNALLLERHMTDRPEDWDSIDFSKVPSIALKKYKRAFERHQKERYAAYLESVTKGEKKINVMRLMPHQLVGEYIKEGVHVSGDAPDPTVEAQWKAFVDGTRATTKFDNAIAMVDVSGSMGGSFTGKKGVAPITVSVALGILIAELSTGPFGGKFITFSANPTLHSLQGNTLYAKCEAMATGVAENTNIQRAFDLLLNSAKMFNATPEQMPKTLFIFSDMQFDCINGGTAIGGSYGPNGWTPSAPQKTNFDVIKAKYVEAGYQMPRVVFWNLRGDTDDFVVTSNEEGVSCLSGFSSDILNLIVDGEEISPVKVMLKAINNPRYDRIRLEIPPPLIPQGSASSSVTTSTAAGIQQNFEETPTTTTIGGTSTDPNGCILA